MIVTLIPAAGASSRMGGGDKLLETIHGTPILRRTAKIALTARLGPVIATLPPNAKNRREALLNLPVEVIEAEDAAEGMAPSLRAGARAAREHKADGMMICLPDMPEITAADLKHIAKSFADAPIRAATEAGDPGHPTWFPARLLPEFERLSGDKGAATLARTATLCPLPGLRARLDLDTPEEWAEWRKATNTPD